MKARLQEGSPLFALYALLWWAAMAIMACTQSCKVSGYAQGLAGGGFWGPHVGACGGLFLSARSCPPQPRYLAVSGQCSRACSNAR